MKLVGIVAVLFLLLAGKVAVAAPSDYVVSGPETMGGSAQYFIDKIRDFRTSNTRVVLPGVCASSCTLYTALLRDGLICARPEAKLVFHRFVRADYQITSDGLIDWRTVRIIGPLIGQEFMHIWKQYPLSVRKWIMKVSPRGLPPWGRELVVPATKLVPTC